MSELVSPRGESLEIAGARFANHGPSDISGLRIGYHCSFTSGVELLARDDMDCMDFTTSDNPSACTSQKIVRIPEKIADDHKTPAGLRRD